MFNLEHLWRVAKGAISAATYRNIEYFGRPSRNPTPNLNGGGSSTCFWFLSRRAPGRDPSL